MKISQGKKPKSQAKTGVLAQVSSRGSLSTANVAGCPCICRQMHLLTSCPDTSQGSEKDQEHPLPLLAEAYPKRPSAAACPLRRAGGRGPAAAEARWVTPVPQAGAIPRGDILSSAQSSSRCLASAPLTSAVLKWGQSSAHTQCPLPTFGTALMSLI